MPKFTAFEITGKLTPTSFAKSLLEAQSFSSISYFIRLQKSFDVLISEFSGNFDITSPFSTIFDDM